MPHHPTRCRYRQQAGRSAGSPTGVVRSANGPTALTISADHRPASRHSRCADQHHPAGDTPSLWSLRGPRAKATGSSKPPGTLSSSRSPCWRRRRGWRVDAHPGDGGHPVEVSITSAVHAVADGVVRGRRGWGGCRRGRSSRLGTCPSWVRTRRSSRHDHTSSRVLWHEGCRYPWIADFLNGTVGSHAAFFGWLIMATSWPVSWSPASVRSSGSPPDWVAWQLRCPRSGTWVTVTVTVSGGGRGDCGENPLLLTVGIIVMVVPVKRFLGLDAVRQRTWPAKVLRVLG